MTAAIALFALCLGASVGYFLAGVLHWRSYRDRMDDMQFLEEQWRLIDQERVELSRSWLQTDAPEKRVELDLGAHKRAAIS